MCYNLWYNALTMLPAGGRQHSRLLIKYIKSFLWRVAKCLSCIEEAWCLKVNSVVVNQIVGTGDGKLWVKGGGNVRK